MWGIDPGNQKDKADWQDLKDVFFLGKIDRGQLVKEQLSAQVHSFPCIFKELFCISVAECQVAGAWPVTSSIGALPTTNQWGTIIWGESFSHQWCDLFIDTMVEALNIESSNIEIMRAEARKRFDWQRICEQWETLIATGQKE